MPKMSEKQWTETKMGGKLYCEILTHQRAGVFGYISAYFNIRCTLSE